MLFVASRIRSTFWCVSRLYRLIIFAINLAIKMNSLFKPAFGGKMRFHQEGQIINLEHDHLESDLTEEKDSNGSKRLHLIKTLKNCVKTNYTCEIRSI